MLFIYKPGINLILRNLLKPFSKIIPSKYHFLINGKFKIKLEQGKEINIRCNPTSDIARLLFWGGVKAFEYNSVRIFLKLVIKSKVFIDIGANIGYYSLVAATLNNKIKIFAFEPSPAASLYLKRNIRENGFKNIVVEQVALSNFRGNSEFFVVKNPKFSEIENQLCGDSGFNIIDLKTPNYEIINVRTETLDDYVDDNISDRIDLMKIDTEASEHLVLTGGKKVLEYHRPIILCEVLPNRIEDELQTILSKYDYYYFKAHPEGLVRSNALIGSKDFIKNYFMIPVETIPDMERFIFTK